jgi:hypothetical protein
MGPLRGINRGFIYDSAAGILRTELREEPNFSGLNAA